MGNARQEDGGRRHRIGEAVSADNGVLAGLSMNGRTQDGFAIGTYRRATIRVDAVIPSRCERQVTTGKIESRRTTVITSTCEETRYQTDQKRALNGKNMSRSED